MGSEWQDAKLKDICELIVDCPHSTPKWTEDGVVVLRSPNIKRGRLDLSSPRFTDKQHYEERSRRATVESGDLVITREAPMGEVCMVPDGLRCCLGQRMVLLRPDADIVAGRYLLFALQSPAVQHEIGVHDGTGSTVSNLRIPSLKALPVPLPPLPEQRAIAGVLGSLDDKIELNRRMNRTLESMARALFRHRFLDHPDPAWETTRLDAILTLHYGKSLPKKKRKDGDVPVYGSGGRTGMHNESLVDGPGLIVGRKGSVGKLYWEDDSFFPIDTTYHVEPKAPYSLHYLALLLESLGLEEMNTDAAVPGLNRENVYRLEVPDVPEPEIESFNSVAVELRARMSANLRQSRTLSALRDTLLPRLLSGALRPPADRGDFGPAEATVRG